LRRASASLRKRAVAYALSGTDFSKSFSITLGFSRNQS
jgi:hypothetical protein